MSRNKDTEPGAGALPETLQGLPGLIAARGDAPALVQITRDGREDWTCAALARRAGEMADLLAAHGLTAGQRVVLTASNSPRWFIACLALLRAGAVPVPVDTQAASDDLAHILRDSGARIALTSARLAERLREHGDAGLLILPLDGGDQALSRLLDAGPEPSARSPDASLESPTESPAESPLAGPPRKPEQEAVLFYTSGTSGPPKGVPLTHANLLSNAAAILAEDLVGRGDRLLLPLPLHHVYPFALGLLATLAAGIVVVLPYSLTGPQLVRALRDGEVTAILGIPRLYAAVMAAIERRLAGHGRVALAVFNGLLGFAALVRAGTGLRPGGPVFAPLRRRFAPRLRLLICGGAALDPDLARRLDAFGWGVAPGYGLTETSPILTFNPPDSRRFHSPGRALRNLRLRIGEPQPGFLDGEVQAQGPSVFAGYLDMPEANAAAFTDDGWFRTGDLGRLDAAGWLTLHGRASSRIVLAGGENVDPERIEARLESCPSIREAGVLEHGGGLAAVLVPEPDAARDLAPDALAEQLRREVTAAFRTAPTWQRIGTLRSDGRPLPRTRLGKLRRQRLAARFADLAADNGAGTGATSAPMPGLADPEDLAPEDRQLLEDPAAERVWNWLGERFSDRPVTPDSDLHLDLGVDSLAWVALTLDLEERLGLALDAEAIGRIGNVRDLLRESAAATDAGQVEAGADLVQRLRHPLALIEADQRRWLTPPTGLYRLLGRAMHGIGRLAMHRLFRLQAEGVGHIPAVGACVLVANHLSALDPIAIESVLRRARSRTTCWGGWRGLMFGNLRMRTASRALRVLPVDPRGGPLASLALAAAALEQGCMLVWFPEGSRSDDGSLKPFRPGIGRLLQAWPVPVVPVHLAGTREALPPHTLKLRLRPLRLRIGAPLDPEELARTGPGDSPAERIANALRARVAALGEE